MCAREGGDLPGTGSAAHRVGVIPAELAQELSQRIDRPTRRRAGVFRRALRREANRLHERRRVVAIVIISIVVGLFAAGLIARGEEAGADARAYWAGARIWFNGGDPYHPTGPFLPYVYAPWLLPVFVPWALLPWDVAWFAWRVGLILCLVWTVHWAYRRHPLATALLILALAFPFAANLDSGNINLLVVFLLWAAQFTDPPASGLLWGLATTLKWVPAPFIVFLAPRARLWGVCWLAIGLLLSLATLPATLVQLQVLFGFNRPARVDYLVFVWALVPWLWRHPKALRVLDPRHWPALSAVLRTRLVNLRTTARPSMRSRVRAFFGLARSG